MTDEEVLEHAGWTLECSSPLEISLDDSRATGLAAQIVIASLREEVFQPELGQLTFGTQGWQEYPASNLLIAALRAIQRDLERIVVNITQTDEYNDPFYNTGASFKDPSVCFEVQAYCWSEKKERTWNFKWQDVEICWYKNLGRSTSCNKNLTPDEIETMLDDCLKSLEEYEKVADTDED